MTNQQITKELKYKELVLTENANNLTILIEEDYLDNKKLCDYCGESYDKCECSDEEGFMIDKYSLSFNYSIDGTEENIEEYHLQLDSYDSDLEAQEIIDSTLLINEKMDSFDSIAMYVYKNKRLNEREMFYIDRGLSKSGFDKSEKMFVLGSKSEEGVHLWLYSGLNIKDFEGYSVDENGVPNFMPKDEIDILTFKNTDEIFDNNFVFEY